MSTMGFLWEAGGNHMGLPWDSYGMTLGLLWDVDGILFVICGSTLSLRGFIL